MNAVITDRSGNRLHVPPTLPRLALSQREFQRQSFAAATARQLAAHRAALAFLNRLPETRP
jgi:hypothetical protein